MPRNILHLPYPLLLILLLLGPLPAALSQPVPSPDVSLPAFGQWTIGGRLSITPTDGGFSLSVPPDGDWGHVWIEGDADLDATPYVALWVTRVSRDTKWILTANDPEVKTLEPGAEDVGLAVYDLREKTGWRGRKRFRLYFTVQGRGGAVEVAWAGLFRSSPAPVATPLRWTRMNGADTSYSPAAGAVDITLTPSGADQWGGLITRLPINVDRYPLVEATVNGLAPDTRWRIALAGMASGPEQHNNGTVAFNYRDFTAWRGPSEVDIQTIFLHQKGGQAGVMRGVRFVPYPTASAALVRAAQESKAVAGAPLLTTGGFRLTYDRAARVFRIAGTNGGAALVSRFLEMPGFDLFPTSAPTVQKTATGSSFSYTRESQGATFTVIVDAPAATPGLLHTRVTVRPNRELRLASWGHEWAYASENGVPQPLRRWATQNLAATALSFVTAPGVGRVFYLQNLTALNPLFDACGMSPRWIVSAGDATFGCANPLDTAHAFKLGETFVLSDAYLYLSPEGEATPTSIANGFLQGLAATCGALPDRPQTQWVDWPGLAEQSLQDLLDADNWRDYNGKLYLQSYVGPPGSSPLLASTQDVYAPLLAYHPTDPKTVAARETILTRFRSVLPTFWLPERNTFREAASPGDHVWYNIPFHVTIARAALEGEAEARELCLKSVPALMRLATDTKDTFLRPDLTNSAPELVGTYILFLMQCYALDPQEQYLAEARRVAQHLAEWSLNDSHETYWTAMTCEGLARLYAATKDRTYIQTSLIPLARLLRNTWLWECDFGLARGWSTYGGINADASGIDYIAAMEQYQCWYSLSEYCRLTDGALPPHAVFLVDELIRHIPMTIWSAYPAHLPPSSLHQGEAFWKSKNRYELAIPLEDISDGWRKNGSVGQEIYGAGACFALVNNTYTAVPQAGCTVFSEHLLMSTEWDASENVLTLRLAGAYRSLGKIEVRGKAGSVRASVAHRNAPEQRTPLTVDIRPDGILHLEAPGDSVIRLRFSPPPTAKKP